MQLQDERTGFARADLAAMPALEDAPELYRPAPAPGDPLTRQDARRDEDFALRAAAQATALTRVLSSAPPEGNPDGFAARQLTRFDDESAALLDGAPSPRAEEAARAAIGRARGRFADWALPQEAVAQTVARRQNLIETLAQFRAAVEQRPGDADGLYVEGAAAIAGARDWLGNNEKTELNAQWKEELYSSSVGALLRDNPSEAARRLNSGEYDGLLRKKTRYRLLKQATHWNKSVAFDRALSAQAAATDAAVEKELQRQSFVADFRGRIENGLAHRTELDEAVMLKLIPNAEAYRLASQIDERQTAIKKRESDIAQVTAILDGKDADTPTAEAMETHFEEIMKPAVQQKSPWEQGLALAQYMEALDRVPPPVEKYLWDQLYHIDPQHQMDGAETITALRLGYGRQFLRARDLEFAAHLYAFKKEGYAPGKAVKLAEKLMKQQAMNSA